MATKLAKTSAKRPASSAQALAQLTTCVAGLLDEGGLEAQFAEKILRRIHKEAEKGGLLNAAIPEGAGLSLKLEGLDAAITQSRADGLVEAMENLRRLDAGDVIQDGA